MIMPARERAGKLSFISLKGAATAEKKNLFAAIVSLNAFERFVFVMSVLERQSDEDCSSLLGCSRRDITIARTVAIRCLANIDTGRDQPGEALLAWQTSFANHHA
jgi:DNA-directed RNA polymerase specialized sigma24 family protein